MTLPPSLISWADPLFLVPEGERAMQQVLKACVPYYSALYDAVEPLRRDALTERGWQAALTLLDALPAPLETDGKGWVLRWRQFLVAVWAVVAEDTARRIQATRAKRTAATRPKTKTTVDWGKLL